MTSRDAYRRESGDKIFVPVARSRALTRALIWLVPALVIMTFSWTIVFSDGGSRPAGSLGIVGVAMLLLIIPLNLFALALLLWGLRWLLLAVWPGSAGVHAGRDELMLALGPFGTRRYDTARFDVRYFYELDDEAGEEGFEAFLPEEEQIKHFLPRIVHPATGEPLNRVMMRYVPGPESAIAQTLRPMIALWRGEPLEAEPSG